MIWLLGGSIALATLSIYLWVRKEVKRRNDFRYIWQNKYTRMPDD